MVRTRFAPSPTGYLHIGGVRTALFNWLFARRHGGQFVLRIDDTDQQRNVSEALRPILAGFEWLGIDWDEGPTPDGSGSVGTRGPYFQSQRGERYREAVSRLIEARAAYYDYARPEEIQEQREAAEREKRQFVYDRRWMADSEAAHEKFRAAGRQGVVRLKMPRAGQCTFRDLVRGQMTFDWAKEPDHVIQRADGSCLYHLATVVDDHDLEISHVIRAEEHLSNTPRQVFIFQSLGYDVPEFAHLPYVAEPGSKNKLSKRKLDKYLKHGEFKKLMDHGRRIADAAGMEVTDETFNPVIIDFYRAVGFLPDALVNYLLLLGWSLDAETEDFDRTQMIEHFSLERVNKAPASFDPQKLVAFQQRYMDRVDLKKKVALVLPFLQRAGLVDDPPPCDTGPYLQQILTAAGDRITVAGDVLDYADFFLSDDQLPYEEKAFQKRLVKPAEARELLTRFRAQLAESGSFDAESLESLLRNFVEAEQIKMGQIIHALRVSVTGKAQGFGMFETLAILGKERCLRRINRAVGELDVLPN